MMNRSIVDLMFPVGNIIHQLTAALLVAFSDESQRQGETLIAARRVAARRRTKGLPTTQIFACRLWVAKYTHTHCQSKQRQQQQQRCCERIAFWVASAVATVWLGWPSHRNLRPPQRGINHGACERTSERMGERANVAKQWFARRGRRADVESPLKPLLISSPIPSSTSVVSPLRHITVAPILCPRIAEFKFIFQSARFSEV